MFNLDPRTVQRLARQLERVLIVDPNMGAVRLAGDLLKQFGARRPFTAATTERGLELARDHEPQLILVELEGPDLDGVDFTHRLRRSDLAARKSPIIVVTSTAREGSIRAARDAGAHEFLCKPFTSAGFYRRVENVALRSRLWVEGRVYVGPDRRRFNAGEFVGERKRRSDASAAAQGCPFAHAAGVIREELARLRAHPVSALRGMLEQAAELQAAAFHQSDPDLTAAVTLLQRRLLAGLEAGTVEAEAVEEHLTAIGALREGKDALLDPERGRAAPKLETTGAAA